MRDTLEIPKAEPRRLEGWHVLVMLLTFFGAIFAVNGYFLVSALSTHSGVVSVEPYRKGLAYNQRIAADERQSGLDWRADVAAARSGEVSMTLTEASGQGVRGLVITGTIVRPATGTYDRPLLFSEQAQGRYVSRGPALDEGTWIVNVEARTAAGDTEPVFRARRRLWLKH